MWTVATVSESSDRLADIQAIRDVVALYCRGVDRLDLELVRRSYHPDAIDHHTGFDGTVDDFLRWLGNNLEYLAGSMYLTVELHQRRALRRPHGAPCRPVGDRGALGGSGMDPARDVHSPGTAGPPRSARW